MYASTDQVKRLIREHGELSTEEIHKHFPDMPFDSLTYSLFKLYEDEWLTFRYAGNSTIYTLLPKGHQQISQSETIARLISEIADMRKNLEELQSIPEITNALKEQTNSAIKEAHSSDKYARAGLCVSILALFLSFIQFLFQSQTIHDWISGLFQI